MLDCWTSQLISISLIPKPTVPTHTIANLFLLFRVNLCVCVFGGNEDDGGDDEEPKRKQTAKSNN